MPPIPASAARDRTPPRSALSASKSRWQWLSISTGCRLHVAREDADRWRKRCPCPKAPSRAEAVEATEFAGDTEEIKQSPGRLWHHCLQEHTDLPQCFSGDVEHGLETSGIALAKGPGLLCSEVAVGVGH